MKFSFIFRFPHHGRSNSTTSVNTLYSSSYHASLRRPKYHYENSLPTSPNRSETPLLNLLSDTRSYSPPLSLSLYSPTSQGEAMSRSKRAYQYHNSQLDMYLHEYRSLQHELTKMKQTCDSLTSNPKSILKKHNALSSDTTATSSRRLDANYWLPRKPFTRRLSTGDFYES